MMSTTSERLDDSLAQRFSGASGAEQQQLRHRLDVEYAAGRNDACMDCYHLSRERWIELTQG